MVVMFPVIIVAVAPVPIGALLFAIEFVVIAIFDVLLSQVPTVNVVLIVVPVVIILVLAVIHTTLFLVVVFFLLRGAGYDWRRCGKCPSKENKTYVTI